VRRRLGPPARRDRPRARGPPSPSFVPLRGADGGRPPRNPRRSAGGGPSGLRVDRRLLLAVAASLVVGAAAGSLGTRLLNRDEAKQTQVVVVAQVDLVNLKPRTLQATGQAAVVDTAAGQRLKVDVSKLAPQPGHFYEVWLIDRNVKNMVAVGTLSGSDGEFVIPPAVDLSQYPIVDISVQQPGDPRQSGNSVLRRTIPS
jgi:hypothetical protein